MTYRIEYGTRADTTRIDELSPKEALAKRDELMKDGIMSIRLFRGGERFDFLRLEQIAKGQISGERPAPSGPPKYRSRVRKR